MELKRPKNDNAYLVKENRSFMNRNDHDLASRDVLLAEAARRDFKTKGEFIKYCKRYGYLKTDRDRAVVKDVLQKLKLPEDFTYDSLSNTVEIRNKKTLQRFQKYGVVRKKGEVTKAEIKNIINND